MGRFVLADTLSLFCLVSLFLSFCFSKGSRGREGERGGKKEAFPISLYNTVINFVLNCTPGREENTRGLVETDVRGSTSFVCGLPLFFRQFSLRPSPLCGVGFDLSLIEILLLRTWTYLRAPKRLPLFLCVRVCVCSSLALYSLSPFLGRVGFGLGAGAHTHACPRRRKDD